MSKGMIQGILAGLMAASVGLLGATPAAEASFLCGKRCQQNRQTSVTNGISVRNCWDASQGKSVQMKVYDPSTSRRGSRLVGNGKVSLPPGTIMANQCITPTAAQTAAASTANYNATVANPYTTYYAPNTGNGASTR